MKTAKIDKVKDWNNFQEKKKGNPHQVITFTFPGGVAVWKNYTI